MNFLTNLINNEVVQALINVSNLLLAIVVAIYTVVIDKNAKKHTKQVEQEEKKRLTIDAYSKLLTEQFNDLVDLGEAAEIKADIENCFKIARDKTLEERQKYPDFIYWPARLDGMKEYRKIFASIEVFAKCMFPEDGSKSIYDWDTFAKIAGSDVKRYKARMESYYEAKLQCGFKYNGKDMTFTNKKPESMKKFMEKIDTIK